jgi:hypothetical protein
LEDLLGEVVPVDHEFCFYYLLVAERGGSELICELGVEVEELATGQLGELVGQAG